MEELLGNHKEDVVTATGLNGIAISLKICGGNEHVMDRWKGARSLKEILWLLEFHLKLIKAVICCSLPLPILHNLIQFMNWDIYIIIIKIHEKAICKA